MKLNLTNFKQHKSFEIEFPDSGMILVKGETGKGKTTIFEAIYFAITGDADDVVPWCGDKPVSVEFNHNSIQIRRTHSPDSLSCTVEESPGDDRTYTGDAAQKRIFDYFSAQSSEFTAAYYIRQRMEGSLLSYGPSQMLRFIQKLAFGDQDPELYKKRIQDQIKLLTDEKKSKESAVLAYKAKKESLNTVIGVKQKELESLVKPNISEENPYGDLETILKSHRDEQNKLAAQIRNNERDMKLSVHSARDKAAFMEDDLRSFRQNTETTITNISNTIKDLQESVIETDDIPSQKTSLSDKKRFIKWKQDVESFTVFMKQEFSDFAAPASVFLNSKNTKLADDMKRVIDGLIATETKIQVAEINAKKHKCPKCGAGIEISGQSLVLSSAVHEDCAENDISALKNQICELQKEKKELTRQQARISSLIAQATALKAAATKDPLPAMENDLAIVEAAIQEISDREISASQTSTKIAVLKTQISSLNQDIAKKVAALSGIQQDISRYAEIKTLAELELTQKELRSSSDKIQESIDVVRTKIEENTRFELYKMEFDLKNKYIQEKQQEFDIMESAYDISSKDLSDTSNQLAGMTRLKEISDAASILATEGIINTINEYANEHIQKLFPDGGTSIKILSGTKTQKGDDRSKLALSVMHKGQSVGKTINPLSGGEKDRSKIAFQLALGEIYHSQFLVVDEPFAGIDVENNMETCLSLLKEVASNKLIIVAQHGAPEGIFDAIIDI